MGRFEAENNPYTLQFSYIPPQLIERTLAINEIVSNFIRKVPTYRGMFITGIRGCGKTVMLGEIRNKIGMLNDWITVDLNPESNLLDALARELYIIPEIKALFIKAKLDFSVLGIGVHVENAELVASNEEDAVKLMLQLLKKAGRKVLVTIDEITYGKDVAKFSHALSSYAGADYDIFVLMTGLAENIKAIKNQKSLTFLYRAKVKELDELNITAIVSNYQRILQVDRSIAEELAFQTRGYSLAFQALGYHYYEEASHTDKKDSVELGRVYEELDITLSELAYEKIWDELSDGDKRVLIYISSNMKASESRMVKVEDIRRAADMTAATFNTFRTRLADSGVIDVKQHGYVSLKLPRFEKFIDLRSRYEEIICN